MAYLVTDIKKFDFFCKKNSNSTQAPQLFYVSPSNFMRCVSDSGLTHGRKKTIIPKSFICIPYSIMLY